MQRKTYSGALGDGGILLSAHHLNMSRMSLVGYSLEIQHLQFHCQKRESILKKEHTSNTTVSTVGAASHDGGLVDSNVVDHQILHVESLSLSVSLKVVQEHQEELASSLRPSADISGSLDHMALSVTANGSIVSTEGNGVLVGNNVVEVLLSLHQGHSLDGSTDLVSVLEVNGQVRTTGKAAYNNYNQYLANYSWRG